MNIGRNQYAIVPSVYETKFKFCKRLEFGKYTALLGDRCNSTLVSFKGWTMLLLGYAIDGENPDRVESEMLSNIALDLNIHANNLFQLTLYWCGRWALFITNDDNDLIVCTDCCALKQVFYSNDVFASQSRYVAYVVDDTVDDDAKAYMEKSMSVEKEYSWPLGFTLYNTVKRLLPNHIYINGNVTRAKIDNYFSSLSRNERVVRVSALLKNTIKAAAFRKKLAVTLTAGWDSRIVFAACNDIKDKVDIVTLKYHNIDDSHIDIKIPKDLCAQYGYDHHLLPCKTLKPDFVAAYKEHSENAHDYWIQMTQSIEDYGYDDWFWTKGSCNEISRNSAGIVYDCQVTAKMLCKLYGIHYCDYSARIIHSWLNDLKSNSKDEQYSLLDYFYWEHRLGSWLAECLNEADIVGETFTPFNTRAYFEMVKNVPVTERVSPYYRFFEGLLDSCGMDLSIPVNPGRYSPIQAKIKCLIKNRLHFIYGILLNR